MKQRKKIGIGPEGLMHKQFGALMNKYEQLKRLDCIFWSYSGSGERRSLSTGSLLKAKGLKPGQPDYMFIRQNKRLKRTQEDYIFIEFKKPKTDTPPGKQSISQKDFEDRFKNSINSRYFVVYSIDEALKVLEKERILLV